MEQRSLRVLENPVDRLARTIEALLVIAPAALSVDELAAAAEDETERVETALGLLASRYREGRSGIVLEQVAGGYAFRAAREAADACARLVERPVQRGLSQAALETLAIVAYRQPIMRAEIEAIRGVASGEVLRSLLERRLVKITGRAEVLGRPMLYGTTSEFLKVFGLATTDDLPQVKGLTMPPMTASAPAAPARPEPQQPPSSDA